MDEIDAEFIAWGLARTDTLVHIGAAVWECGLCHARGGTGGELVHQPLCLKGLANLWAEAQAVTGDPARTPVAYDDVLAGDPGAMEP
jgi:hypothetical protein